MNKRGRIGRRVLSLFACLVLVFGIAAVVHVRHSSATPLIGSAYWKVMTPLSGYQLNTSDPCWGGGENSSSCPTTTCDPFTYDAYSTMLFAKTYPTMSTTQPLQYYTDSNCTNTANYLYTGDKIVKCGPREVLVGQRLYEWYDRIDDEHVDAYCAPMSWTTLGAPQKIEPPNATTWLYGAYKEADCPAGTIATGIDMWGQTDRVDDEHINIYCSAFSGSLSGSPQWIVAANAGNTLYGGYKETTCPNDQVVIGLRWYEWTNSMDEEHVDILCQSVATPTVNVKFQ